MSTYYFELIIKNTMAKNFYMSITFICRPVFLYNKRKNELCKQSEKSQKVLYIIGKL
ncbi:MAG: hypothetical protein K2K14_09340 [Ruminococcus sp.]|nr:hypothetical protein [Ruminococcus sp.]